MNDEDFHVFGIAETFLKIDDSVRVNGLQWCGKNRTSKGGGGIGFLINKNITILDDDVFDSKSDEYERLWVKLCLNSGKSMYIAVAYFPVEGTDVEITEALYNQLLSEVIRIRENDLNDPDILIMGDMNGRIGKEIPDGDPVYNSNGKRLLHFVKDSDLTILNCTRQCIGKFTWFRAGQQSTIDYMLCSNNLVKHVKQFVVDEDRKYGLGSDHNVLLLTLHNNSAFNKRENGNNSIKRWYWDIKDKDFSNFQNQVHSNFDDWQANSFDNPDTLWDSWKKRVIAAASDGLGVKEVKSKCNSWFDDDIDQAIKDRRNPARMHRGWAKGDKTDKDTGDNLWKSYQDKRTYVKSLIRKRITEMRVNRSIDIANKGGPSCKDFWKVLKGSNSKSNSNVYCIKDPVSNDVISDRKRMNQTILQYWSTLGKMNINMNDEITIETKKTVNQIRREKCNFDTNETDCIFDVDINIDTVIEAISNAKNNKSPGIDGITNELLKNGGKCLHKSLFELFSRLIDLEKTPSEWNHGIIVPIFKKGDRKDLNNYRGISLTSCVAKVFNKIVATSVSNFLESKNVLTEVQGGFRSAHRCEDHIFTVKSIAACRLAEGKKTFMAFLDFRKAFDTVWRDGLMLAIWNNGIRGRVWRLIDSLYDNVQAKVKFGDIETDFFNVEEGVKQGCVLSPVLFCVFMHEFTKLLNSHDIGVRIHDVCTGSLFWADDVVLLANDENELNRMLDIAAQFAERYKLSFNYDKSNVLIVGQRIDESKNGKLGIISFLRWMSINTLVFKYLVTLVTIIMLMR
ncbi:uncharacterized protein [Amphiura filiformis]|uniref:uncharacterized protein n=1 Tax=Amphiura filiformis TaxID=82378 RepID=UPI003B214F75